jgi:chemotaxis signal transduction protein
MTATRHYLNCRVGEQWYGLDVEHVVGVLHLVALTEVPAEQSSMLGLMTLRDEVMPVFDLRRHFGIAEPKLRLDTPIIAVRTTKNSLGLVVDEVDNVELMPVEAFVFYNGPELPYISGMAKHSARLILLIDPDAIASKSAVEREALLSPVAEASDTTV